MSFANSINQGMVAKHLAIMFLENGYKIGYESSFESLKPQLSKEVGYLYRFSGDKIKPLCYLHVKNDKIEGYVEVTDNFNGVPFEKYLHTVPTGGFIRYMDYLPDDVFYRKTLSDERAVQVAELMYNRFVDSEPYDSGVEGYMMTRPLGRYIITRPPMTWLGREDFEI